MYGAIHALKLSLNFVPPAPTVNNNGFVATGPIRPMLPLQQQNRYDSYNGNVMNGVSLMQQRRQNSIGIDNAINDSVK